MSFLADRALRCFTINQATLELNPTCDYTIKGSVSLIRDGSMILLGGNVGLGFANATDIYNGNR